MNKNKKLALSEVEGLIPDIRFPDFENDGEWSEKKLGTIAKKIVERNKNGLINNVFTNSAIEGIVDQREYFDKDIADKNNLENYYIVEDEDYVYNPRISNIAPVGPISKNKTGKTGAMSPLYTVFRFTDKNNGFYEYYFNSVHWYGSIRKASNTGARFDRMSITDSAFMDIPVLYPKPKEQQKIASCLSSLDEVIAAHSQKLELLKDHKKGLMQNLFPQEGEKVPKLRFKEFENDGEWVERNESVKILSGVSYKMSEYTPKGVRLVQGANIFNGYYSDTNTIYIDDKTDNQRHIVVKKGDILLGLNRPITNDELKVCLYPFDVGYLYQRAGVLKYKDEICSDFLYQFLCSPPFLTHLKKELVGSDQPYIKSNLFATNILITPQSFQEQRKIASCLSSLDALIAAQADKIEQLKLHKKGLLQGLFPKMTDETM